jgi:hypothetical protein
MADQPLLELGQLGDVGGLLEPGDVGVAADGTGGGAGGIQQHGVERLGRHPFAGIALLHLGLQRQALQIGLQSAETRGGDIDRPDLRPGMGELRGLAAGRSAQIGDALARHIA